MAFLPAPPDGMTSLTEDQGSVFWREWWFRLWKEIVDILRRITALESSSGNVDVTSAMTPYYIPAGEVFTVPVNKQVLWKEPIVVDGALVVNGLLIQVLS